MFSSAFDPRRRDCPKKLIQGCLSYAVNHTRRNAPKRHMLPFVGQLAAIVCLCLCFVFIVRCQFCAHFCCLIYRRATAYPHSICWCFGHLGIALAVVLSLKCITGALVIHQTCPSALTLRFLSQ